MLLSVYLYRKQCMLSTSGDREENINAEEVAKKVKDAAKIIRLFQEILKDENIIYVKKFRFRDIAVSF